MKVTSLYYMVACFVHRIDENTISFGAVFGREEAFHVSGIVVLDDCEGVFRGSLYKDVPVYEESYEVDGDGAVHWVTDVVEHDNSMQKEVVITFRDKFHYNDEMVVDYSIEGDDGEEYRNYPTMI